MVISLCLAFRVNLERVFANTGSIRDGSYSKGGEDDFI